MPVANGGTGQSSFTDGQLLIGNTTGNTLTKSTLTAGTGVSITNGNGSITIAATGTGGTVTNVNPITVTASGNTFTSTVTNATSTPAINLTIPLASVAGTTAGLLSKVDYDVFNAKQNALIAGTNYIAPNAAITGATKTKITYDEKGLVTAGADATTADIAPSTNRNYVTDIKAGVLSNTTGVNTGDQTITLTGDVTGTGTGTFTSTIANAAVTYAKMQNVTAGKLLGSISGSDAAPGAVAIGSGLSLSGGTLTASGTGGTVTSVNPITVTASGSTFTSTVTNASTTPAISLTIPLASVAGTTAGLLSNTDYAIFNAKQGALTAGSGISIASNTISATGLTTSNLSSTAGILNGQLANSAITLGSTSMSLGSTNTTIAGLTSVTSTGFTGALTGNASTATALATARSIYGNNFDGTAALSGVISTTFGGTGASSTSQNFVFAGPTSGAGAPGFRLLTSADVPAGSGNYIANGTTQQASSNFNISGTGVVGTSLSAGSLSLTTALTVANGGTGATTLSGLVKGNGTSAMTAAVAGTDFVAPNSAITAATKTKLTYDTKGLVTAGADATTADIAPSTDRNYVTDIKAGVLSNTSGVNTGDQTITLTGDVTGTGTGTFTSTIANSAVTYAKMQNVTAGKLLGSTNTSAAAPGEVTIGSGLSLSGGTLTASGTGGTVTNVNPITVTASGSTFTSTVTNASTTPAIALTIPLASQTGTTAGLLSNTDYATFNAKQGALTAGSGISIASNTISATGITTSNLSSSAGILNGQLANSSITLGSTSMSLGSTNTTIAGLTSVTSTGFTGALTGNASTATALATARSIYGNNFDGTAALSGVISTTFGGTGASSTSQNFVFAGPTSGAGAPGFRLLTSADVPAGSGNYIANGTTQQASSNFNISGSGVVGTSLSAGSLSLTTALSVPNGGTGATTLSGLVKGNGINAMTAAVAGTDFMAPSSTFNLGTTSIALNRTSAAQALTGITSIDGSAASLTTSRLIYGGSFNGSADVTNIIASTFGGTGNGFAKFTGPTTAEKTFTLPDASATILTSNTAVTAAQGGTSQSSYVTGDILYASATNTLSKLGIGATGTVLTVSGGVPSWGSSSGITGTGTQNYLPKYNNAGGTTLGNSLIFDNGTSVGINTASPGSTFKLDVNGAANFASDIVVNGIKIGKRLDPGYEMYATSYGVNALANYVVGAFGATAFGNNALQANTNGAYNNAFGIGTLFSLTTGSGNTAIGSYASYETSDASNNVIIGHEAGRYLNTADNTIIGYRAGQTCCTTNSVNIKNTYIGSGSGNGTAGSKNVIIGSFSGSSLGTINNNIILSDGDGTIRYRWDGTTNNFNTGSVAASSFIKSGGSSSQYLMADGSVSSGPSGGVTTISGGTTGLTPSSATSGVVTLAGTLAAANGGTGQSTYATGDILYASAANTLSKLTIGSTGTVLTVNSGVPSWGSNGLYSLNGITSGTHSLTTGVTGTDFNISSSGSTHTFNIPDAGATSTTRGLVSINAQTFYGAKTFNSDIVANGYTIGTGRNNVSLNLAIGSSNFATNATGNANIAIGISTMSNNYSGQFSTAVGHYALSSNSTGKNNNAFGYYALYGGYGSYNTAIGDSAITSNGTSILNTAVGNSSMKSNTSGSFNTAVGNNSLLTNTTGTYNTAIGVDANVGANNLINATAIGANATVTASNTIQLGNTSVTSVVTSGTISSTGAVHSTLKITGGTLAAGSVLVSDASGNATWGSNGLYSLNGQSATSHTFATANTASSDFTITSSLGTGTLSSTMVHTFNLPDASATARGAVTTGVQTFAGNKTFSGTLSATSLTATSGLTAGTVTYPNTHGTSGQILSTTGSGTLTWTSASAGISGVGTITTTSYANGATVSGNNLILAPASSTNGGILTNGTQTIGGQKSFDKAVTNSVAYNASAGTTIDFSNSNLAYTSASPGNTFTLNNMKDGGTYTLAIQGTTSGTAAFTTGFTNNISLGNYTTVGGKQTVYTFVVMGNTVYYSMVSAQ
jgi:hypothetical protein